MAALTDNPCYPYRLGGGRIILEIDNVAIVAAIGVAAAFEATGRAYLLFYPKFLIDSLIHIKTRNF